MSASGTTLPSKANSQAQMSALFALATPEQHSYWYRQPSNSDSHNAGYLNRHTLPVHAPLQESNIHWKDEGHLYEGLELHFQGNALTVTGALDPGALEAVSDAPEADWASAGLVGFNAVESQYLYPIEYFFENIIKWIYAVHGDRQVVEQPDMSHLMPKQMLLEHRDESDARDFMQDRQLVSVLDDRFTERKKLFKKAWEYYFDMKYVLWYLQEQGLALRAFALKGNHRMRLAREKISQLFLWDDVDYNQRYVADRAVPTGTVDLPITQIDLVWHIRQFTNAGLEVLRKELMTIPSVASFSATAGLLVQIHEHRLYEHFDMPGNSLQHDLVLTNFTGPIDYLMVVVYGLDDVTVGGTRARPGVSHDWHNRRYEAMHSVWPSTFSMQINNSSLFSERDAKAMIYLDNPRMFPLSRPGHRVYVLTQDMFPKLGAEHNHGLWDFSNWVNPRIIVKWKTSLNDQLDALAGNTLRKDNSLKARYSVFAMRNIHMKYTPSAGEGLFTLEVPGLDVGTSNNAFAVLP